MGGKETWIGFIYCISLHQNSKWERRSDGRTVRTVCVLLCNKYDSQS